MLKKGKEFLEKKKLIAVNFMITCSLIAYNTVGVHAASSGISSNLSNGANGAQQEVLSWVEAVGGLGIVIGAIVWFAGNTKLAKTIISSVGIGYVLVKFAPDLWKWFTSVI